MKFTYSLISAVHEVSRLLTRRSRTVHFKIGCRTALERQGLQYFIIPTYVITIFYKEYVLRVCKFLSVQELEAFSARVQIYYTVFENFVLYLVLLIKVNWKNSNLHLIGNLVLKWVICGYCRLQIPFFCGLFKVD